MGLNDVSVLKSAETTNDVFDLGTTMLWIAGAQGITAQSPLPQPMRVRTEAPSPCSHSGGAAGTAGDASSASDASSACADAAAHVSGPLATMTLQSSPSVADYLEKIRSYDPSLMLLLQWMTERDSSERAVMTDVLRHP